MGRTGIRERDQGIEAETAHTHTHTHLFKHLEQTASRGSWGAAATADVMQTQTGGGSRRWSAGLEGDDPHPSAPPEGGGAKPTGVMEEKHQLLLSPPPVGCAAAAGLSAPTGLNQPVGAPGGSVCDLPRPPHVPPSSLSSVSPSATPWILSPAHSVLHDTG